MSHTNFRALRRLLNKRGIVLAVINRQTAQPSSAPLRAEAEHSKATATITQVHFNPPAPWGAGPYIYYFKKAYKSISIHPLRGERDVLGVQRHNEVGISIHPLRGERDIKGQGVQNLRRISIHPLRGERDEQDVVTK